MRASRCEGERLETGPLSLYNINRFAARESFGRSRATFRSHRIRSFTAIVLGGAKGSLWVGEFGYEVGG